jgi:hypothetical protein
VHGLGVAQRASLRDLDGVHVTDEVPHAGVRGGELLDVPFVAVQPGDRQVVAGLLGQPLAARAHRCRRVVVDLAALDDRGPLVEQGADGAHQAGLALAALPEEDEVVAGEQGALELGQHGVVEADDAGERGLARSKSEEEVLAELGLDGARAVAGVAEGTQGCGSAHGFSVGSAVKHGQVDAPTHE